MSRTSLQRRGRDGENEQVKWKEVAFSLKHHQNTKGKRVGGVDHAVFVQQDYCYVTVFIQGVARLPASASSVEATPSPM